MSDDELLILIHSVNWSWVLILIIMNEPTKTVDSEGTIKYRLNGKLHRTDGPAVEDADGTKEWIIDGKYHRTDGPAIEWYDGDKTWYIDDVMINGENYGFFQSQYPELIAQFLEFEGTKCQ